MPWLMNVGVLYYRTDLLAKYRLPPPDVGGACRPGRRACAAPSTTGRLDGVVCRAASTRDSRQALEAIWANGGRVFGADGAVFPEEERAAGGLSFLRALIVSGVSPSWVTAADEELSRRHFGDGRADLPAQTGRTPWTSSRRPARPCGGRVGMAPLPGRVGGAASAASSGGRPPRRQPPHAPSGAGRGSWYASWRVPAPRRR